jgi:hypothetical protein
MTHVVWNDRPGRSFARASIREWDEHLMPRA